MNPMMGPNRGGMYTGLVALVVVLFILGGLAAAGFAKTEFGNYFTAQEEARKMEADTAWAVEMRQIDLPYIQAEREAASQAKLAQIEQEAQIAAAQAQADLDRIEAEKVAALASIEEQLRVAALQNNQKLANEAQWAATAAYAVRVLVIAIASGGVITVAALLVKRVWMPQVDWKNAAFRKWAIAWAKRQERQARKAQIKQRGRHNGTLPRQPLPRKPQNYDDLPQAQ